MCLEAKNIQKRSRRISPILLPVLSEITLSFSKVSERSSDLLLKNHKKWNFLSSTVQFSLTSIGTKSLKTSKLKVTICTLQASWLNFLTHRQEKKVFQSWSISGVVVSKTLTLTGRILKIRWEKVCCWVVKLSYKSSNTCSAKLEYLPHKSIRSWSYWRWCMVRRR